MTYQNSRTFQLPTGAHQLTNPSQIPYYKILGQVGQTGTPGSYLYGTPKEDSFQLPTKEDSRQLPILESQPVKSSAFDVKQQTPTFDRNKILQDTISAMLKAAQGAGDEDLIVKRNAIVQARFNAQRQATPEELRVLSPSQQASLRGLDVGGLEEQLGGVSTALSGREKKRAAQIEAAKTLFDVLLKQQELEKSDETPDIKEYKYAKTQGYEGSFIDYQTQVANLKIKAAKSSGGGGGGGGSVKIPGLTLTRSQLNQAKGNYFASNLGKAETDFDALSNADKYAWYQGGPEKEKVDKTKQKALGNVSSLISKFAERQDIIDYWQSQGYNIDDPDFQTKISGYEGNQNIFGNIIKNRCFFFGQKKGKG